MRGGMGRCWPVYLISYSVLGSCTEAGAYDDDELDYDPGERGIGCTIYYTQSSRQMTCIYSTDLLCLLIST